MLTVLALSSASCSSDNTDAEAEPPIADGPIITTVAGAGQDTGVEGEGVEATEARLFGPGAVTVDAEGNIYFSDEFEPTGPTRIRMIDTSGIVTTIVGTDQSTCAGLDGPAIEASITAPHGLVIGPDGDLYFVSVFCYAVFKIEPDGSLTTIAGQPGVQNSFGDGGPATDAGFGGEPSQLAFDAEGNLYVTDFVANQVRKIDTEGIITTIAGTGEAESTGDGGPAVEASLNGPDGLAVDAEGNVYVTEFLGHRIRKIDTNGIITTVAGTGERASTGDEGPAIEATFYSPHDIEFDAEGNLYVAEEVGLRIRRIDAEGIITTIAGTGERGFSGDGGPATQAQLYGPISIAFDAGGNLYIAEVSNDRIRMVALAGA